MCYIRIKICSLKQECGIVYQSTIFSSEDYDYAFSLTYNPQMCGIGYPLLMNDRFGFFCIL